MVATSGTGDTADPVRVVTELPRRPNDDAVTIRKSDLRTLIDFNDAWKWRSTKTGTEFWARMEALLGE